MYTAKTNKKTLIDEMDIPGIKLHSALTELYSEIIAVYLFGSLIKGARFEESDIDIALLLDETISPGDYFDYRLNIVDIFAPVFGTEALDAVILNEASTLLRFEIIKNGKLIFCRNDALRSAAEVKVMEEYYDTQYYRDISNAYLKEKIKAAAYGI